MCGRYTLTTPASELATVFRLNAEPTSVPRYNIAPTQPVPVVRLPIVRQIPGQDERELTTMRWGLIPHWASDPAIGNRMINARAETVAEKPAFREAFRKRRCLIVADGFYEWKKAGKKKQPYRITLRDGQPFAFAGLWDEWEKEGEVIESCTVLTTTANAVLVPLHDRMPVILAPKDYDLWLDCTVHHPEQLQALLQPYPAHEMTAYPVSTLVNSPRNETPQCAERQATLEFPE